MSNHVVNSLSFTVTTKCYHPRGIDVITIHFDKVSSTTKTFIVSDNDNDNDNDNDTFE